jgi:hypothetical protein
VIRAKMLVPTHNPQPMEGPHHASTTVVVA